MSEVTSTVNTQNDATNNQAPAPKTPTPSFFSSLDPRAIGRNIFSGAFAGTTIATLTFPAEAIKKALQAELTKRPPLYRGLGVFVGNILPTTTVQYATDGVLKTYMPANASFFSALAASAFCGVTGALTATFVENTIIRQQMLKSGPIHAIKDMFAVSPFRPWKSGSLIAGRDGIFTMCMMTVNGRAIKLAEDMYGKDKNLPRFVASTIVGVTGAALSHPLDTIATRMQKTHDKTSALKIARDLVAEQGARALYKGFLPRLGLFMTFANAIPLLKVEGEKIFDNHISPVKPKM